MDKIQIHLKRRVKNAGDVFNALTERAGWDIETAAAFLDSISDADAVEVVRCKDCKYWFKNNGHDKNGCPILDSHIWMGDNGFCSCGERGIDD